MRLQNPFAAISATGIDSQVLFALARTEEHLTVAQIQHVLPESGSLEGVRKSVARLVRQGTVSDRTTGRTVGYALNRDHLLAGAILEIATAKQELVRRLARTIEEWPVQPVTVKLFGSAARGDMTDASDIDLLVVMSDATEQDEAISLVDDLARRGKKWTGNDVRPLLYVSSEVRPASIFDSILAEGIDIAGDPVWLRRTLRKAGDRDGAQE